MITQMPAISKGMTSAMANPFPLNPDESILYRSRPSREWYALAWRIGLELFEVALFILFSFTALTGLARGILARFLPTGPAAALSWIIFQGIVPILATAWFAEDTVRIFTSELILTDQRIWTKGSPYAWTPGWETPLTEVKSMSSHRDAIFIHLKSNKKPQVHLVADGKQIVRAFTQFSEGNDPD